MVGLLWELVCRVKGLEFDMEKCYIIVRLILDWFFSLKRGIVNKVNYGKVRKMVIVSVLGKEWVVVIRFLFIFSGYK